MIPFIQILEDATLIYGTKIRMMAASALGEIEKGQEEILWVIKTFCIL